MTGKTQAGADKGRPSPSTATRPGWRGPLLVFLAVAVCVATAGRWFYVSQRAALQANAQSNLEAVAKLKVAEIGRWRLELLSDAKVLTEAPIFCEALRQWLAGPRTAVDPELLGWPKSLVAHKDYDNVLLVDPRGHVYFGVTPIGADGLTDETMAALGRSFVLRAPVLSELHEGAGAHSSQIDAIAPLFAGDDGRGEPLAAVILVADARHGLYPLIRSWPTPSASAETLLVRRVNGVALFLNDLRDRTGAALHLRVPLTRNQLPSVMAVRGETGMVRGVDYRGVDVLATLKAVPNSQWYMVTKIDASEALAVWRVRSALIVALTLGLVLVGAFLLLLFWQHTANAHYRSLYMAEAARCRNQRRIEHLNAVLLAVRNVSQLITQERDPEALLRRTCDTLTQTRGYSSAWIALRDTTGRLRSVAQSGLGDEFAGVRERLERGEWPACCLEAFARGGAVVAHTTERDCGDCPAAPRHRGAAVLAAALRHRERDIGVLTVSLPEALADDAEEQMLFGDMAADVALALDAIEVERERTESVATLRQHELKLQALFAHMSEGLAYHRIVVDEAGSPVDYVFVEINAAFKRHTGLTDAILGRRVTEVFPDIKSSSFDWIGTYGRVALTGETAEFEQYFEPCQRWFAVSAFCPEPGFFATAFRDVGERKRMEAQVRRSQKLESIGTLAGGVAHEINNPVMGVMNYAELIADLAPAGSPIVEYAGEVKRETERVARIVRNLLGFARQDTQEQAPARMHEIVEATLPLIRTLLRHDQIRLETDVARDLPPVCCCSQQIQQVLLNLLTNARDALNERYPGAHQEKRASLGCGVVPRDGRRWVRLTVCDRGPGIPPEIQDRIFDPFFTTKARDHGSGLGLSIAYGIVRDHGGELSVESQPGSDTCFHVDLPLNTTCDAGDTLAPGLHGR